MKRELPDATKAEIHAKARSILKMKSKEELALEANCGRPPAPRVAVESTDRLAVSVYSDASVRHGRGGFAVTVVPLRGAPIYKRGPLSTGDSLQAEIDSLVIGIGLAPQCERLVVYYDLDQLPRMLDLAVSYSCKHDVTRLLAAAAKFSSVEWRRVDPQNKFYKDCHRRAYKSAGTNVRALDKLYKQNIRDRR